MAIFLFRLEQGATLDVVMALMTDFGVTVRDCVGIRSYQEDSDFEDLIWGGTEAEQLEAAERLGSGMDLH